MRILKDTVKNHLGKRGYTLEKKSPFETQFKTDLDQFNLQVRDMQTRHKTQTKVYVDDLKKKYETPFFGEYYVWDIIESLSRCFDPTDVRLGVGSQEVHLLQMVEGMDRDGVTDQDMYLAAIIHDMAKALLFEHEPPENIGFNNNLIGDYPDGIGLDNVTITFSQDEYLYLRLKDYLPDHLAWLIRYHGISVPQCKRVMDKRDREYTERYLTDFAKYDMGTKCIYHIPNKKIEDYRELVESTFPNPISF
ncbi:MAG: inositol oxygenase family protein [Elainellaceae cyanobacterium]